MRGRRRRRIGDGSFQVVQGRYNFRVGVALLSAAVTLAAVAVTAAGCSGFGAKKQDNEPVSDPNAFPATYRTQLTAFLRQSLTDRADFRGALISPPTLKPIADSQRYMVCVQFNGHSKLKNKVAIYFGGQMAQFIDSTPAQCGDAAYQPFNELEAAVPPT